jgi:hypothetical protein
MDPKIVALILASVDLVYLRPRLCLRKTGEGAVPAYELYRNGRQERNVPTGELSELKIYLDYRKYRIFDKVSRSWRESQRPYLVIRATSDPDIVLYDQREHLLRPHRNIVKRMKVFFGDIRWNDQGRTGRQKDVCGSGAMQPSLNQARIALPAATLVVAVLRLIS